jgi:hypothetical protein
MTTTDQPAFEGWAIVELMGHRRLAGMVTEAQIAGHAFIRLDVPAPTIGIGDDPEDGVRTDATQFYSPAAVYCITPTSLETALKVAAMARPAPATRWELDPAAQHRGPWPADDFSGE